MSDNPEEEETKKTSQGGFFSTLLKNVIWMIVFVFVGIAMLYGCKVAAANLIPTTLDRCEVNFDSVERKGKMITAETLSCIRPDEVDPTTTVNITIANNKQGVPYSKKLTFNYDETYEKYINSGLFKYLKVMQSGNNASKGTTFISKMVEGAIFANFSIFDNFYKMVYSSATTPLGETLVIFVLPMIFMYIYPFFMIINMFLFVGFYFFNLNIFTKKRDPEQPADPPMATQWINYDEGEDGEWSTFGKFLLYLGGFFMMGIPLMIGSVLGLALPIYAIVYPLFVTGKVGKNNYNFGNFFTDMLKFKKHMIMYYFSYNVVMGAYKSGPNGLSTAITAFLAFVFIWVFDKMFGVFTTYDWEKNDSKVMTVMTGEMPSPPPITRPPVNKVATPGAGAGAGAVNPAPSAPPYPASTDPYAPSAPPLPLNQSQQVKTTVETPLQPTVNQEQGPEQVDPSKVPVDQSQGPEQVGPSKVPVAPSQPPVDPSLLQQQQQVQVEPQAQQQQQQGGPLEQQQQVGPPVGPPVGPQFTGGKTDPPEGEGMLGFGRRLLNTIVYEPIFGKKRDQNGGKVKTNTKNVRTRKTK